MIEFTTTEVGNGPIAVEAACLITPVDSLPDDTDFVVKDGEKIELPQLVVTGMVDAIRTCAKAEEQGMAVDCSVFGAVMLGGTYNPIDLGKYQRELHWEVEYGAWLGEEELFGTPDAPRITQFARFEGRILPRHTAVQLPDTADLYVQKIGHGYPVALTDAAATFRFHGANCAASVDRIRAGHRTGPILAYANPNAAAEPMMTYRGLPI